MDFKKASKLEPMEWTQPEHDEERTDWAAGRANIKKVSAYDRGELAVVKNEFDDAVKEKRQVGPRTNTYFSTMSPVDKDDAVIWQHYYGKFKPYYVSEDNMLESLTNPKYIKMVKNALQKLGNNATKNQVIKQVKQDAKNKDLIDKEETKELIIGAYDAIRKKMI